jgi:uncharacterized OB-fold protein
MTEARPNRKLGGNHDIFWDYCSKGELRLQRCRQCGELQWPVVAACDHCGHDGFTWEAMSGRGTVLSWCTFDKDYYAGLFPMPWDVLLVELEEGPLFISNPHGFTREEIAPDMPVKVAFLDCEDQAGAFKLPVFERT